jgi:hypothetical protein
VVSAVGAQPLAGAQVGVPGGPQTRADERGEWTLAGLPAGTRMLEVRAVGFYPERRPVDVVEGAAPVRVQLATLKAVLDAVKVTARYNEARAGFAERRRGGAGRDMTADDVMKHAPVWTSDLFRRMPGLRVVDGAVKMRGPFGDCSPALYLDGHYFDTVEAFGLDGFVAPQRIAGIEVYTDASAPAQFRRLPGAAGEEAAPCGSIVIWTK